MKFERSLKIEKIYENTYVITDSGISIGSVNMYLLIGDESALLIDSGYGGMDLHNVIGRVTTKPVICACTHGHLDHALGASQFEKAYLHSNDGMIYQQHISYDFIYNMGMEGIMNNSKMGKGYDIVLQEIATAKHNPLKPLDDIPFFELGNRKVSWVRLPGHTQGSVAFFDEQYKTIFDGDGAPNGAWLFLKESSSLEDYILTLKEYINYIRENGIVKRYVGHMTDSVDIRQLNQLVKCVEFARDNPKNGKKIHLNIGDARELLLGEILLFCKV